MYPAGGNAKAVSIHSHQGRRRSDTVGISRSNYIALELLDVHGPLTPGELGELLALTSGAVTALIDRLEDVGWATRQQHPDDRRKVVVALTKKAWKIGQDELKPYLDLPAPLGRIATLARSLLGVGIEAPIFR